MTETMTDNEKLQEQIYKLLMESKLTSNDIAKKLNRKPAQIRPRLTEMKNAGQIRKGARIRAEGSTYTLVLWEAIAQ